MQNFLFAAFYSIASFW